MLGHLQDHIPLFGANYVGRLTGLQRKNFVFEFFRQSSTLEIAEVPAILCRRAIGVFFRHVRKLCTFVNLVQQILSFGVAGGKGCLVLSVARRFGLRARGRGRFRWSFRRDQNFTQPNLFGLVHFRSVLLVKPLLLVFVHGQLRAYFLANHFLRDYLVAQVLLEFFIGSALGLGRLLQFFHGSQIHLLASLVQTLDECPVPGNAHFLALLQKQLLVNQVPQNVALPFRKSAVGRGRVLLLNLLLELVAAPHVLRARNDLVIDAGNNIIEHGIRRRKRREQQPVSNCQKQGKCSLIHEYLWKIWDKEKIVPLFYAGSGLGGNSL